MPIGREAYLPKVEGRLEMGLGRTNKIHGSAVSSLRCAILALPYSVSGPQDSNRGHSPQFSGLTAPQQISEGTTE